MAQIAQTQSKIQNLDKQAHTYQDTQKSVMKYFSPHAVPKIINRVGDKQLLKGKIFYKRQQFIRNEDPPGKGNIPYEINEMIMMPENFQEEIDLDGNKVLVPITQRSGGQRSARQASIDLDNEEKHTARQTIKPQIKSSTQDMSMKIGSLNLKNLHDVATPITSVITSPTEETKRFEDQSFDVPADFRTKSAFSSAFDHDPTIQQNISALNIISLYNYYENNLYETLSHTNKAKFIKQATVQARATSIRSQSSVVGSKVSQRVKPLKINIPKFEQSLEVTLSNQNQVSEYGVTGMLDRKHFSKSVFDATTGMAVSTNAPMEEDGQTSIMLPSVTNAHTISFSKLNNTARYETTQNAQSTSRSRWVPARPITIPPTPVGAMHDDTYGSLEEHKIQNLQILINSIKMYLKIEKIGSKFETNADDYFKVISNNREQLPLYLHSQKGFSSILNSIYQQAPVRHVKRPHSRLVLDQVPRIQDASTNIAENIESKSLGKAGDVLGWRRTGQSPFNRKTQDYLSRLGTDYDYSSYKQSLVEEETSKKLVKKANRLKNNINGGFVTRRKTQLLGFKLLQALQFDTDEVATPSKMVEVNRRGTSVGSKQIRSQDGYRSLSQAS